MTYSVFSFIPTLSIPLGTQEKNVNILDGFSLSGGLTKGVHPTIYKPLKSKVIDSISIKLTDQKGRPMHFEEGYAVTCLLHIRSR